MLRGGLQRDVFLRVCVLSPFPVRVYVDYFDQRISIPAESTYAACDHMPRFPGGMYMILPLRTCRSSGRTVYFNSNSSRFFLFILYAAVTLKVYGFATIIFFKGAILVAKLIKFVTAKQHTKRTVGARP